MQGFNPKVTKRQLQYLLTQGQADALDCGGVATAFLQRFSTLSSARETLLEYGGAEIVKDTAATAGPETSGSVATASAAELRFRDLATGRCAPGQIYTYICAYACKSRRSMAG